jgi:ubiquinone biosynthesis protein COQ9
MSEDPIAEDAQRAAIIDALLPQVPFDGWTSKALRQALASIGEHPDDAALYFPDGPGEMIEAFSALADARMEAESAQAGLAALRIPARIRAIIAIRLQQNRGNKEAIRRALSWLAVPTNAPRAVRITAATVDTIWHAAGDKASDFSWYTKRGILAGVYSATLLYWLRDSADDDEATLAFLDRRLANVAGIGKLRSKIEGRFKDMKLKAPRFTHL